MLRIIKAALTSLFPSTRDGADSTTAAAWRTRLVRGGFVTLTIYAISAFLILFVNLLLARALGVHNYGVYTFMVAAAGFTAVFGRSGLDAVVIRFIPEYRTGGRILAINGLLRAARVIVVGVALVCALVMVAVIWQSPRWRAEAAAGSLIVAAVLVPFTALMTLNQGILQGFGRSGKALLADYLIRPAFIGIVVAIWWWITRSMVAPDIALASMLAALTLGLGLQFWWIAQARSAVLGSERRAEYAVRNWLGVALPVLGIGALSAVLTKGDVLLLGTLRGATDVGYYNVAVRISAFVSFGVMALSGVVAPMVSELYASSKWDELHRLMNRTIQLSSVLGVAGTIGIIVLAPLVFRAFGPEFKAGWWPLLILLGGRLVSVSVGPVGYFLLMTNSHRAAFWILVQAALLEVGVGIVTILLFGAVGAAIATSLAMTSWNIAMVVYLRRKFGWWIVPFYGIPRNREIVI